MGKKNKLKTKKAAAKRFKVTANGKIMRRVSGQSHFNSKMSGKKRRNKRKWVEVSKSELKAIKRLLPYK
ncbi:MAG: 50S ribosomal protein L35 [Candidatus Spechtbacterales bacterium]|nr:50S ribosomal protein L35 [Candidatus Spechtbacterales bacterium]